MQQQPQARIYKPFGILAQKQTSVLNPRNDPQPFVAGLCQHVIFLFGSSYCMSFSLRIHNKVVNGGEKLHFTLILNPNPPNPSSFYASQEPILNWPTVTHSLFPSVSYSLSHFPSQIKIWTIHSTCYSCCRQLVSFSVEHTKGSPEWELEVAALFWSAMWELLDLV